MKLCQKKAETYCFRARGIHSSGDLVNEAMMRLFQQLPAFDPSLRSWSSFAFQRFGWSCADFFRRRENNPAGNYSPRNCEAVYRSISLDQPVAETDSGRKVPMSSQLPDRPAEIQFESDDSFNDLVRGLDTMTTTCLRLVYLFGFTMKDAGRVVGVSESRVSQLVTNAKKVIGKRSQRP